MKIKTKSFLMAIGSIFAIILIVIAVSFPFIPSNNVVYEFDSGLKLVNAQQNWSITHEMYSDIYLVGSKTIKGELFSINLDGRTLPDNSDLWPDLEIYNFELSEDLTAEEFINSYLQKENPDGEISDYKTESLEYKVFKYELRYYDPVSIKHDYVSVYKSPSGTSYLLVARPYAIKNSEIPKVLEHIVN
ncbi:hypothetical protein KA036_02095 [Candidatus Gracilibacteria bacterium]|nr:hypothetical protein [Candidatus Gracilibacteria bacterium]